MTPLDVQLCISSNQVRNVQSLYLIPFLPNSTQCGYLQTFLTSRRIEKCTCFVISEMGIVLAAGFAFSVVLVSEKVVRLWVGVMVVVDSLSLKKGGKTSNCDVASYFCCLFF